VALMIDQLKKGEASKKIRDFDRNKNLEQLHARFGK
jgi:hypothetical protein